MTATPTHKLPKTQQPLLKLLGQEAAQLGYTAYVVGGFVRDSVLSTTGLNKTGLSKQETQFLDIDIVLDTNIVLDSNKPHNEPPVQPEPVLPAIQFAHHLQKKYGGQIITHSAFGTAKWITDDPSAPIQIETLRQNAPELSSTTIPSEIDLVTARDEIYTEPAALPTITPSSLTADLQRRDITTNTLAVCLAPSAWQQLIDQHHGISDIQQKLIRVLHDQSFVDDPTRIFRAIRYEQRFTFHIEPHTLSLLRTSLPHIEKLTPVRIRHELDRTLAEDTIPELILQRMDQLGVLTAIHPALRLNQKIEQTFTALRTMLRATQPHPSADTQDPTHKIIAAKPIKDLYWILWLAPLPPQTSHQIAQRIELPKETLRIAHDLHALSQSTTWPHPQQEMAAPNRGHPSPSQIVAAISQFDPLAVALFAATTMAANEATHQAEKASTHQTHAKQYLAEWQHIRPHLTGDDLRELGIPPGPCYRELLTALRNQRLDGHLTDRASEIAYIKENS